MLQVLIGSGENHRMGLYDMMMVKDNHTDVAGGIKNAIAAAAQYIKENELVVGVEVIFNDLANLSLSSRLGESLKYRVRFSFLV